MLMKIHFSPYTPANVYIFHLQYPNSNDDKNPEISNPNDKNPEISNSNDKKPFILDEFILLKQL